MSECVGEEEERVGRKEEVRVRGREKDVVVGRERESRDEEEVVRVRGRDS